MSTSIKNSFSHQPSQESIELKAVLGAVLTDLTALRTAVIGLAAKLDDDATVTDTNYEALWTPAVLTLTA